MRRTPQPGPGGVDVTLLQPRIHGACELKGVTLFPGSVLEHVESIKSTHSWFHPRGSDINALGYDLSMRTFKRSSGPANVQPRFRSTEIKMAGFWHLPKVSKRQKIGGFI